MSKLKVRLAGFVDSILCINPLAGVFVGFAGLFAIVASLIIEVGGFEYALNTSATMIDKQVGYIWAFNWSITSLILIPAGIYFGLMSYQGLKTCMESLVRRNMILSRDGSRVATDDVFDAWRSILIAVAIFTVLITGVTVSFAYWEYQEVVGQHFEAGSYPEPSKMPLDHVIQERDWSVAALLPVAGGGQNPVDGEQNRLFSLTMYILLPGLGTGIIFGFFVFLIGFIWFLYKLERKFLLFPDLNDPDPRRGFQVFSDVVEHAIWVTVIVFLICYLMIIQNLYLRDEAATIYHFVISELSNSYDAAKELRVRELLGLIAPHSGGFNLQSALSFVLSVVVTVIVLGFVVLTLRHLAKRCQERVVERLSSGDTVPSAGVSMDKDSQMERAKVMSYWPVAWPTVNSLLCLILMLLICIVSYKVGFAFVALVIVYAANKVRARFWPR